MDSGATDSQTRSSSKISTIGNQLFHVYPSTTLQDGNLANHEESFTGLNYFKVFIAPASGPRTFVTMGFEDAFVRMINQNSQIHEAKWAVGASTGALRFTGLVTRIVSGQNITKEIMEHYCSMTYQAGDTPQILSPMMDALYHKVAPTNMINAIISCKKINLAIFVSKLNVSLDSSDFYLKCLLGWFGLLNLVNSKSITRLITRYCFYTGDEPPTFIECDEQPIQFCKITEKNFYQVLKATCCIPFVSERCTFIDGAGPGLFFDGALTDYMLNFAISNPSYPALLLGDYTNKVVKQTFFDLYIPWRQPPDNFFRNCTVVCPSEKYVEMLPDKQLPTVSDWFDKRYMKEPSFRQENWKTAYELSLKYWPLQHAKQGNIVKSAKMKE